MLSGIYALYWEDQDLIYIGLSTNLDRRFNEHLNLLKRNKHFSYKVQNAFNNYGMPEYHVLECIPPILLNEAEISYIKEFDAFNTGLNSTLGGTATFGENHPNSLYSNEQIIEVFLLLYQRQLAHKEIVEITKVHLDVVKAVSNGYLHPWLEELYPAEYKILLNSIKEQHNSGEQHSASVYTNKQILEVFELLVTRDSPLVDISNKTGIKYSTVSMIACGAEHTWLKNIYPDKYEKMLTNIGKVITNYPLITDGKTVIQVQNAEQFCREHNLQSSNLNKVFKGTRKTHKGWYLYNV